jgi:glycosyltransferase involved in cell wall biosynthesis
MFSAAYVLFLAISYESRSCSALITIAVPSFNQGRFLDDALTSIFSQSLPMEVFVADGGSIDDSLAVIRKWESRLAGAATPIRAKLRRSTNVLRKPAPLP